MRAASGLTVALFVALFVVVAQASVLTEQQTEFLFNRFVDQYEKQYEVSNFFAKYNVFRSNLNKVMTHNEKDSSYKLAMNEFGDLTQEQFQDRMKLKPINNHFARSFNLGNHTRVSLQDDESFDWRSRGAMTPVKNQGQCGSCWAFSATASIEGAHFIKTGRLVDVSEQQLIDCSGAHGNNGCSGGLMDHAFEWTVANGGICTQNAYPYAARNNRCKRTCTSSVQLLGYRNVQALDEVELAKAVKVAPVSVGIEASNLEFQFYSSGVFDGKCGTKLDHGMAITGFGVENGTPYWWVRNSYGAGWGQQGMMKVKRGVNKCGISMMASYAVAR